MFELIMFWVWVSLFTYMVLIGPWMLVTGGLWKYVDYQLDRTELEHDMKRSISDKFYRLYIYPSSWVNKFSNDVAGFVFGLIIICGIIIWMATGMHQIKGIDATGLVPDLISGISAISAGLAKYTSWLGLPVVILGGFHILSRKAINFFVGLKAKLDKLA